MDRLDAKAASDGVVDLVPGEPAIRGDVEVLAQRLAVAEQPDQRRGHVGRSRQRSQREPSPVRITGRSAIMRRMTLSPSPTWMGMWVRTVRLGRTIVQVSLLCP